MQVPLEVSYRNLEGSPAIDEHIRARVQHLERLAPNLIGCKVMVEAPHRQHHQGKIYHVRVHITLPGHEVVASRDPAEHHAHEDVYVALRDAFDAAERRLQDVLRRMRGQVKHHDVPDHGRISALAADGSSGRIEAADGRDLYFHRNALVDGDFDDLRLGDEVRFVAEAGEQGPQASSVRTIGKHHPGG
jgi:ribosomal subunit interface protein